MMASRRRHVIAIGPIPPPTTGLAVITERMIELLRGDNDVNRVNVSPPATSNRLHYHVVRAWRVARAAATLLTSLRKRPSVYIACDGGAGLAYMLVLIGVSRVLGYRTYLHHHSFGYIDRPNAMMRFVLWAGGPSMTHVFLCSHMATKFQAAYRTRIQHVVVSNAAFVTPQSDSPLRASEAPFRIGLLSNLTRAKGLHTFLDLLEHCKERELPIQGFLAGPIGEPADQELLVQAQERLGGSLTYLGPLHGRAKDEYFRNLDVFVFPTTYANEAQPTVLFEALAAGSLIFSHDRGCIAGQIETHGLVVARDGDFISESLIQLQDYIERPAEFHRRRSAAYAAYASLHADAKHMASALLANPATSDPYGPSS